MVRGLGGCGLIKPQDMVLRKLEKGILWNGKLFFGS